MWATDIVRQVGHIESFSLVNKTETQFQLKSIETKMYEFIHRKPKMINDYYSQTSIISQAGPAVAVAA